MKIEQVRTCSACTKTFEPTGTNQRRCHACRYVDVVCKTCGETFNTKFRGERTLQFCCGSCSAKWGAAHRVNTPRSEETNENIGAGLRAAYADGRKTPWNKLPETERFARKKMRNAMGSALHRTLDRIGTRKEASVVVVLGYTPAQLKEHIEALWQPGMNWDNYGNRAGQWDVDHAAPISAFPLTTLPAEVNALTNLQPMWALENIRKGGV